MIRRLRGVVSHKEVGRIELMTPGGVGYELLVPGSAHDRLPARGETTELHAALVVRDNAMELYGFVTEHDRLLFGRLRGVSGVGPKVALALLGALPGGRIVRAVRGRDTEVLRTVTGVGKKTAERIVLELADKLDDLVEEPTGDGLEVAGASAVKALRALGFGARESEEAVHRARRELEGREAETQELVRLALRHV